MFRNSLVQFLCSFHFIYVGNGIQIVSNHLILKDIFLENITKSGTKWNACSHWLHNKIHL